ncbi:hypothetical protein BDQ12DRAFT_658161 [Crucibulum laeve]|uniref:Uncharacterized protein n=1 Tax=Crucibulum laeve TaxID=68775 RepID=A0A5C3LMU9_9AGAR|nr:hypothetical protein BDQ12DRAFT_658161 [Crucibulum laeve]
MATSIAFSILIRPVLAQAPVNDVISWPPGLLLLATVLYSALGQTPDQLWNIEPAIGLFLWSGLPLMSIEGMQRVEWVAKTCTFVAGIKTSYGASNFWIRGQDIQQKTRDSALQVTLEVVKPVIYLPLLPTSDAIVHSLWTVTDAGLLVSTSPSFLPPSSKPIHLLKQQTTVVRPSAWDFLLFSAIHYHVFWERTVQIMGKNGVIFSTEGTGKGHIFDVESEESAIPVVAAQFVRRPHLQTSLRNISQMANGTYCLSLDTLDLNGPCSSVDFHSYCKESMKIKASLNELASAYYHVVKYLKENMPAEQNVVAEAQVGQSLWIGILGGSILDIGRITFQNLEGRFGCQMSVDDAYLARVKEVLTILKPYANTYDFVNFIAKSGGTTRVVAIPFLIVGLLGQILVCYFLSVGTSAGVWTSVALANALFSGKLLDWHSVFNGRTERTDEPGMKLYNGHGVKEPIVVATLHPTAPRQGPFRQGFLLNAFGLISAILGSIFQTQTRSSLGFSPHQPTPPWVVYTSVSLCGLTSFLLLVPIIIQRRQEKIWSDDSEVAFRWSFYSTLPFAFIISGLGAYFQAKHMTHLWPLLDALVWFSGIPFGMLENGRMTAVDDQIMQMILVNRWMMGAVASAVGSNGIK